MIVAIAGATGLTGNLCLEKLLQNPKVTQVISMGRKKTGIQHLKLVEVGLQDSVKADAFICCLGTTIKKAGTQEAFRAIDFGLVVSLAKKLKANGCEVGAVVSAMGANSKSAIFYSRVKGEMENTLIEINFKSLSILRPSLIVGEREETRFAEKGLSLLVKFVEPFLIGSFRNYREIKADDIAKTLIKCVEMKKNGTSIYLSSEI